ncbi:MAG: ATP-binding protein [Nocardioides sp.]
MHARLIVLAGPSGAGKSRLAERLGLPVLRLDDFYKNGDDPTLPHIEDGPNAGIVDWDHPDSWLHHEALAAITSLCADGRAELPVYEIAQNGRVGTQVLELGDAKFFVAEGIFAQEIVPEARRIGCLAGAYCITQHRLITFWRRLSRDLRERRKAPMLLIKRGWALMKDQPAVVRHAVALGCQEMTADEAYDAIRRLG